MEQTVATKEDRKKPGKIDRDAVPRNRYELKVYLKEHADFVVPDRHICGHHASPMDYLWHAYSCEMGGFNKRKKLTSGDCIVWANRGGGKTQLAAVTTLLEGLFKPRCQTRVLAGSLDQSSRIYEYLCEFVERGFEDRLDGKMLKGSCRFQNGTTVQVLRNRPEPCAVGMFTSCAATRSSCSMKLFSMPPSSSPAAPTAIWRRWKCSARCTGRTA